jgi:hypothetical protein
LTNWQCVIYGMRVDRFCGVTRRGAGKGIRRCAMIIADSAYQERPAAVFSLFPRCYSAVICRCFSGGKAIHIRALAETAGENAQYQRQVGCSSPAPPAKNPRISAASPPRFAAKSAAFAAKRPSPAGRNPPAPSGPAQAQSGCKSATNAARRRSHRRLKAEDRCQPMASNAAEVIRGATGICRRARCIG